MAYKSFLFRSKDTVVCSEQTKNMTVCNKTVRVRFFNRHRQAHYIPNEKICIWCNEYTWIKKDKSVDIHRLECCKARIKRDQEQNTRVEKINIKVELHEIFKEDMDQNQKLIKEEETEQKTVDFENFLPYWEIKKEIKTE